VKDIQSQIKNSLVACSAFILVAIAFMTIPALENTRVAVSSKVGLSAASLWFPIVTLIALALFGTFKFLAAAVAKPIGDLARHVREGESSDYQFTRRAKVQEEIAIKGYIESHDKKVSEVKEQRDELEKELKAARDERDIALSINNRQTTEIAELDRILKKLRVESQTLAAAKEVLEATLETERKTKVGREVKMRAEEIYSQVGRAVSEASARAIWIPNLLQQIETPTTLINDLSKRLESNWNELSLARISEEVSKIREQSDLQCSLLENVDPDGLIPIETEQRKSKETDKEEPVQSKSGEVLIGDDVPFDFKKDADQNEDDEHSKEIVEFIESLAEEEKSSKGVENPSFSLKTTSPEEEFSAKPEDNLETENSTDEISDEATAELVLEEGSEVEEPIEDQYQPDPESLSALQTLVFELVNDYAQEVEKISVEADFEDYIDAEVDEELLESVLSNLLEIAIYQWKEGSVKLRVSRKDDQITFAVDSKGKPLAYGEMDESQTNRITSALDRKIDVDMPSETELRMRYRYVTEET